MDQSRLNQFLTMDNILFSMVCFFSVFWALIFNSIDDPMNNQPIHMHIDLKRNFVRFDEFIIYTIQFLLMYGCGFLIYWINHHLLVNKVIARYGFWHYLWVATAFTLIAAPLLSQLLLFLPINSGDFTLLPSGNRDPFDPWNLQITILIMIFSLPLILSFNWQKKMAEVALLKQQKIQTELKWLQQQINPHFLFNTLNNIYSLALSKSDQAPQSILQLSDLLRFVVYRGGEDQVPLNEELKYLEHYLSLQKIRTSHRATINYSFTIEADKQEKFGITPLLLIVVVENAFKHGIDTTDKPAWIELSMTLEESTLKLVCQNSTAKASDKNSDQPQGIGLQNLRRRLQLAYPDKHNLSVQDMGDRFICQLTLELNEYEAT